MWRQSTTQEDKSKLVPLISIAHRVFSQKEGGIDARPVREASALVVDLPGRQSVAVDIGFVAAQLRRGRGLGLVLRRSLNPSIEYCRQTLQESQCANSEAIIQHFLSLFRSI